MVRRAGRHRARIFAAAAAFVAALAVASCGGGPPPVTRPDMSHLYRGLAAPLPRIDATVLKGFFIVIDPGHGGTFRGTVGQDSLEEAHVNLGVSLYLWGLLREAGADVRLTRSVDRDFLNEGDSTLVFDLQSRVDLVDSLLPDVFISIHHNAQPQRDPTMNRVETYYTAGDPASLDLAFAIHRHLMRNLGIDVGEVRQGNYFVLRNVTVPAVLGESSYLTHPDVEDKLRLSSTQQLEAEAYFLGILDYCRRGIPRVTAFEPTDSLQTAVPDLSCRFEDRGGLGIDPDGVSMTVNGNPVAAVLSSDGRRAVYRMPWDAPNGRYEVQVTARNLGGNTSTIGKRQFTIAHPPAMVAIDPSPARAPRGGSVRVRARVLDGRGLPVADGTLVRLTRPSAAAAATPVRDGAVEFALEVPAVRAKTLAIELECAGVRFAREIPVDAGVGRWRSIEVRNAATGAPILGGSVAFGDSVAVSGSPSGVYGFLDDGTRARVLAPGFRPGVVTGADSVSLTPWFGGALHGKRFVLDPEGGTPRVAGAGQMGLSASHVNLRVAIYLAGYLREAGAEVRVTRASEEVRLPEDVVRLTGRFRADRYLEIRHSALPNDSVPAVRTYYFPGSANGRKFARALGEAIAERLGTPLVGPASLVTYPLQQTACPAIVVTFPSIAVAAEEARLDRASYLREQAYAAFVGLLRHFAVADTATLTVTVHETPPADWLVTLDETWTLVTGDGGQVVFDCVAPGAHSVALRRGTRALAASVTVSVADNRLDVPGGGH
jgi:N-acetylmuramoyl-L-alanine amidase